MESEIGALIQAVRGHQEAVFSLELWKRKVGCLLCFNYVLTSLHVTTNY